MIIEHEELAKLIIHQHMALCGEGIGVSQEDSPLQKDILAWAVELVGDQFNQHDLWNNYLIPDSVHISTCSLH